eukprot:COSAG06_NODE_90_length_24779_cov_33.515843_9_plen_77_part_00
MIVFISKWLKKAVFCRYRFGFPDALFPFGYGLSYTSWQYLLSRGILIAIIRILQFTPAAFGSIYGRFGAPGAGTLR